MHGKSLSSHSKRIGSILTRALSNSEEGRALGSVVPREELLKRAQRVSDLTSSGLSTTQLDRMIEQAKKEEERAIKDAQQATESKKKPIEFLRATKYTGDKLFSVSGSGIKEANTLALFSIVTRSPESAVNALKNYARITSSRSLGEFDKTIDGVVAVYPTCSIHTDNRLTLQWLRGPSLELIPEEIKCLYSEFIEPKLFKDGKLVSPEDFVPQNIITTSFSNRKADMLIAVMHAKIADAGGAPENYLSKIYVLSFAANPYNWTSNWGNGDKTLQTTLTHVPSDMFCGAWDCLTRPPEDIAKLLQQSLYEQQNIRQLKDTERTVRIVNPSSKDNYYGHNVEQIIDAGKTAFPGYYHEGLIPFLRREIVKSTFDRIRTEGAISYDQEKGTIFSGKMDLVTNQYLPQDYRSRLTTNMLLDEMLTSKVPPDQYKLFNPKTHLSTFEVGLPAKVMER